MQKTEDVRIRRAPKFLSFFFLGAGLGLIAAFIANFISEANAPAGSASILGYLVVVFLVLGAGLGTGAALVIDRVSVARAKTLKATKLEGSASE
jgi:drug/metabolite transporter (DMT)-like permease